MEHKSYKVSPLDIKLDEKIIINGDTIKTEMELTHENEHKESSESSLGLLKHIQKHFSVYRNITCAVLYYCYFGYATYCHFGDDEASIRLTVCTGFGTFLILWNLLQPTSSRRNLDKFISGVETFYKFGRRPLFIKWYENFISYRRNGYKYTWK